MPLFISWYQRFAVDFGYHPNSAFQGPWTPISVLVTGTFRWGYKVLLYVVVNTVKILNELRKTKDYPKDRGLSVDCSFMTALICLGQLVSSAIVGVLIESYGSSRTGIHNPIKSNLLTSVETTTWIFNGSWIPEKNYKSLYICHCSCWLFALLVYCWVSRTRS